MPLFFFKTILLALASCFYQLTRKPSSMMPADIKDIRFYSFFLA